MMTATNYFTRNRHIAPLAVLRMAFGAVLFISTIRFIAKGWIHDFYVVPVFHFPFAGFEWLHPLPAAGMYALYALMALAALGICMGLFYRAAAIVFLVCFVYAELLDKTYYLNHYYFVTICSFLLTLVPANRCYSLDAWRRPALKATQVPAWTILVFKYQLCIIYCCAGLSKLTHAWLFEAMPLKIWLPAKASLPVIGPLLRNEFTAYAFSWGGALFDLGIGFLLLSHSTRRMGYALVIVFHVLTAILFQIGMFPYLMMSATLIFFSESFHLRLIGKIYSLLRISSAAAKHLPPVRYRHPKLVLRLLGVYFLLQVLLPFRYMLYPGTLLWTEEGYRFSWRVMLMEKGGTTFFYIKDPATGKSFEVNNAAFLTPYQERMMETQPDMMLQYAHILKQQYQLRGIASPQVTVHSYVTLNGSGSRLYIDSTVNLAAQKDSWFTHHTWVLPFTSK